MDMTEEVDYYAHEPISRPKLVTLLNTFIVETSAFVNRFADSCESSLQDMSVRITNLSNELGILESKLESVKDIQASQPKPVQQAQTAPAQPQAAGSIPPPSGTDPVPAPVEPEIDPAVAAAEQARLEEEARQAAEEEALMEEFGSFIRPLQLRVPPQAVRAQMEGLGFPPETVDKVIAVGTRGL
ncbi:hypothetical protein PCE1_002948 [Barthelona sp. PCE]